ncbi:hypothetical protein [Sphaerisporangium album]|nr:hypothetical protein [Sphaerisporangium album]
MDKQETTPGQVLGDEELEGLSGGQVAVQGGLYIDPPGICVGF